MDKPKWKVRKTSSNIFTTFPERCWVVYEYRDYLKHYEPDYRGRAESAQAAWELIENIVKSRKGIKVN